MQEPLPPKDRPRVGRTLRIGLAALLLTPINLAQEPEPPRWYFSGEEVELVELLDACASALGVSIDYDRAAIQGKVTIRSEEGFSKQAIWALANRQLLSRKLASVQASGEEALGIVAIGEAAKVARIEPDVRTALAGFVKTVKTLHYADPEKVAQNHTPQFFVDEGALPTGIRALANLAMDYLTAK